MKYLKSLIIIIYSIIFFSGYSQSVIGKPGKVILMIGDGMGLAQLYAAQSVSRDALNIFTIPIMGMVKTHSANDYVTDSAAGGTAYGIGKKTNNGVIGLDKNLESHKNLVELFEAKGIATGLVVTSPMTHATPASFIAHNASRKNAEEIALDFLMQDIEVMIGGGRNDFDQRKDGLNLLDSLRGRGFQVITDPALLSPASGNKLAALLFPADPPYRSKGRGEILPKSVTLALQTLDNYANGFFMMVEGSQIDWACHDNDLENTLSETLDFDQTVGLVLDYAKKDGNTLVVVTADHETGGMTLNGMSNNQLSANWTSKAHTGICVPIFAFGPGAEVFAGLMDNTQVFEKIVTLFELKK